MFNCWALDDASITAALEVVPSVTLAALALVIPSGSETSATAAVPARERLRRLKRGTKSSCQMVLFPSLCPISAAVSAWCERSLLTRCGVVADGARGMS